MNRAVDYSELDGFTFPREAALTAWREKKERIEFAALVNRLRVRLWQKRQSGDPSRLDRLRARKRVWARGHRNRQLLLARSRRRKRYEAAPRERTCEQCGKRETIPFRAGGPVGRFCSDRCRLKWRYHHDEEYRERMKRFSRDHHAKKKASRAPCPS